MKLKMYLLAAMGAAVFVGLFGNVQNAQAYNLILVSSQELPVQTLTQTVQLGGGMHQSGPKKIAHEEKISQEQKVESIATAAG